MILYNITAIVNSDIEVEFKEWIHRVFLPDLAKSEIFKSQSLLKIMHSPNEGESYSLQMIALNDEQIETFQQGKLTLLYEKVQGIWADKIYLFETKMKYIAIF